MTVLLVRVEIPSHEAHIHVTSLTSFLFPLQASFNWLVVQISTLLMAWRNRDFFNPHQLVVSSTSHHVSFTSIYSLVSLCLPDFQSRIKYFSATFRGFDEQRAIKFIARVDWRYRLRGLCPKSKLVHQICIRSSDFWVQKPSLGSMFNVLFR